MDRIDSQDAAARHTASPQPGAEEPPLGGLLDRLATGDDAAAAEVFQLYAPYLRLIVRRRLSSRLRTRFDSSDVVQSVWADLVHGFRQGRWHFADAAHLRAFLVKVTHNRFLNRIRRHRRSLEHTQPMAAQPDSAGPAVAAARPSEIAVAEDLWEHMLAQSPPSHQEVLRLKRQGLPLAEIAARTGLHESSVRRILYNLARRFGPPRTPAGEREAPED